ncbi:MAG: hypothetical protein WDN72_08345 [Alphaproteobacteria bacterium]
MDPAALARQQLSAAVTASGSSAAFSPDQTASRQARRAATPAIANPTMPAIEDTSPPAPPTVTLPAAPLPQSFFGSSPLTLGIPFTSQLAAQFFAQEGTVPGLQQPANSNDAPDIDEEAAAQVRDIRIAAGDLRAAAMPRGSAYGAAAIAGQPRPMGSLPPATWKTQLAPKKQSGVIDASGAVAYGVAEARNRAASASVDTMLLGRSRRRPGEASVHQRGRRDLGQPRLRGARIGDRVGQPADVAFLQRAVEVAREGGLERLVVRARRRVGLQPPVIGLRHALDALAGVEHAELADRAVHVVEEGLGQRLRELRRARLAQQPFLHEPQDAAPRPRSGRRACRARRVRGRKKDSAPWRAVLYSSPAPDAAIARATIFSTRGTCGISFG